MTPSNGKVQKTNRLDRSNGVITANSARYGRKCLLRAKVLRLAGIEIALQKCRRAHWARGFTEVPARNASIYSHLGTLGT